MKNVLVCGGGGIGEAVVVLMAKKYVGECAIIVSDGNEATLSALKGKLVASALDKNITFYKVDFNFSLDEITSNYDFVFDCLPGIFAPKVAKLAVDTGSNYINLTEYVAETNMIKELKHGDVSGLVLQSGVAPGFVNLLGMQLKKEVVAMYKNFTFDTMEMKVGALPLHASSPHYYAFTWSPIGVATEYLKPALALVNGEIEEVASLSDIRELVISGVRYENAHTSGGVADLADGLKDTFKNVNYQTMRYPGHFAWINEVIKEQKFDNPNDLLSYMFNYIPHVEDDFVLVYASVDGHDESGRYIKHERAMRVNSASINGVKLKAIQISTAIPMIVTAINVFDSGQKGIVLQSQLDCTAIISDDMVREYFLKG
jgi:saccharopine dehydrogenase-like NADP-dependent oxidoreductase